MTVTVCPELADSETISCAGVVPSSPLDAARVNPTVGRASSSLMVPSPWPSVIVALTGLLRFTKKLSVDSFTRSSVVRTVIVCVVVPAGKFSVPLFTV